MPEIENEVTFTTITGNMVLHTMNNGDTLVLNSVHFTKEQAATLAWLINHPDGTKLEIQIKELQE